MFERFYSVVSSSLVARLAESQLRHPTSLQRRSSFAAIEAAMAAATYWLHAALALAS